MITFHTSLSDEFVDFYGGDTNPSEQTHDTEIAKIHNVSSVSDTIQGDLLNKMINKHSLDIDAANQYLLSRRKLDENINNSTSSAPKYLVPILGIENGNVPTPLLNTLNNYKYGFNPKSHHMDVANIADIYKANDDQEPDPITKAKHKKGDIIGSAIISRVAQSLFNPFYGVKTSGMHTNVPLIDTVDRTKLGMSNDTSDCSIMTLLQLSAQQRQTGDQANPDSDPSKYDLGFQFYRLSDFMYCKHLGSVSNNHLITLRRFNTPIGDNIYGMTRTHNKDNGWANGAEIGHLVTWFGTEDNKLSDIFKFNYSASWKKMDAKQDWQDSKAEETSQGVLGMLANFNPAYHSAINKGLNGSALYNPVTSLLNWAGGNSFLGSLGVDFTRPGQNSTAGVNSQLLHKYDEHKIYEPKNTIRYNNYYEGNLNFEQNFTLNFSYKLNSYSNINGKAAMLDLIANILRVTYTTGTFWGGENKVVGAPHNTSAIRKMDAFIDNKFDKVEGFMRDALTGGINWKELIGSISNALSNIANNVLKTAEDIFKNPKGAIKKAGDSIVNFCDKYNIGDAIKGGLKNALGRPALYAFSSLVHGENTGLWHVTIGNPRNPIMCIGNLIMKSAEITVGDAPLGLDDFPTEIKVSCTMEHAMPRDMFNIQRMFTKGEGSIYVGLQQHGINKFYTDNKISAESLKYDQFNGRTSLTQIFGTNNVNILSKTWNENM